MAITYEPDEDAFLYDGRQITVLRGQHPGNFYSAHVFFLAQQYASRPDTSILRDEQGYPMVGLVHTPRGEEHRHDAMVGHIEWVMTRVLRGLLFRAIRMTREPIRVAVTGFGPFEDQEGDAVPHNVTAQFSSAPERLRGALRGSLPDLIAPPQPDFTPPAPMGPGDVVVSTHVYDPHYRSGRPVTLFARTLPVDTHALSDERESGITGLLEAVQPHIYIGLGVRHRGAPEFMIEEVSDNSGLSMHPKPRHVPENQPTTGHPLNRSVARAFTQGVQELGVHANDT